MSLPDIDDLDRAIRLSDGNVPWALLPAECRSGQAGGR
jgi:hypothetical protein